MYDKTTFLCFTYMQPQKLKFKSVQINMKQVSYMSNIYDTSVGWSASFCHKSFFPSVIKAKYSLYMCLLHTFNKGADQCMHIV